MKFKKFLTANKISSFTYTKYCKLDLGGRTFLVCIYITNFHMWFMYKGIEALPSYPRTGKTIFNRQHV